MIQTKKLDKKNIEDIYNLTPMQEGMLFHYLKTPRSDYYFEQLSLEIPGEINERAFEKAWNFVIETNEMLRAVFRWEAVEKPMQIILKEHKPPLKFYDFSGKDITAAMRQVEEIKAKDKQEKFDLEEVAFRVISCKVDENRHVMIISNHHILYDGWSNGIIVKEFFNAYNDLSSGKEPVKITKTRFKEFIKWVQNRDIHKEREFWKKYLKDFDAKPGITIPFRRRQAEISDTGTFRVKLPGNLNRPLRSFVEKNKVTLSSLFYSAWGILLLKYNSREDMTYDTTVSGRIARIKGIEDIVGLFINTVPLRVNTTADEKTADFILRMSNDLQEREEFENSSLAEIKEYIEENNKGVLFDSVLVIENYPLDKTMLRDKEFSIFERTRYDLTVIITMFDDIDLHFIYNKELLDEEVTAGLSRHFIYILHTLVENPRGKVVDIHLPVEQERTRILNNWQRSREIEPQGDVTSYQAPRDEVERKLAELWASVLKSGKSSIGINSDFFEFGGHSLKASLLAAGIHKVFHVKIPVAEVFKRSTLGELANYLKAKLKKSTEHKHQYFSVKPVDKQEYYALSPAQQRFYIMHQLEPAITLLNMPAVLSYDGHINKEQVEAAFRRLTRRHESLRTSFHLAAGQPVQKVHDEVEFEIEYYLAAEVKTTTSLSSVICHLSSEFIRPFELSRAPLLRAALIKIEEQKYLLVVDIHHMISDGSSQKVLAQDFVSLLAGEELHPLRLQYRDFSSWQGHLLQSGKFKEHEIYWLNQLKAPLPELKLPTDYPKPAIKNFAGNTISKTLGTEFTRQLAALCRRTGTTLYILLLTVLNILFHKYTGESDFIIGSPTAGRGHSDLENIIGLVMGAVLMRNHPGEEKTARDFLEEVKKRTLEAYEHQVYPYEELIRRLGHKGDISGRLITPVGLNVLEMSDVKFPVGEPKDKSTRTWRLQSLQSVSYVPDTSKLDLTVTALEMEEDIILEFEYSTLLFKQETIERFAAGFQQVLREVTENPQRQLWEIDMIPPGEKLELIGRVPRCYPLTHAQKRIYYLEKTYPGTSCNTLAFSVGYQELLDKNLLETAVHTVISRNEGLRLRILEFDWAAEPFQYTAPYEKKNLDYLDFSSKNRDKGQEWLVQQARQPFPLFNHPLFYFAYIKFSHKESGYFVKLHHIISDGVTTFLLFNEIDEVYRQLKAGEKVDPSLHPSYIQYIRDEKAYWHSHQLQQDREFWHRKLLPLPEPVNLSFNQGSSPAPIKADLQVLPFPGELRNRIHEYCKNYSSSLFKLIFAGLSVYISRVRAIEDIVIASAGHNRSTPLHKQMIGMFVSTIPLRVRVEEGISFLDFVEKTGQAINHIIKNRQKYPFDLLVNEIREKTRQDPGFLLNVNLIGHGDLKEDNFTVRHHFPGDEPNPLSLHINPDNQDIRGVLEIEWDYQTACFSPGDILDMHRALINILIDALEDPGKRLADIDLLSPEEKQRLVFGFNDTTSAYPQDKTCRELFEQQVEKTPDQIALVGPSETKYRAYMTYMTYIYYRGLNEKAHQLAYLLKEKGVGPDTIVAIMVERSVEMIIGILGILKAGGAYLPIDPDYPQERINYMLKDSSAKILVTDPVLPGKFKKLSIVNYQLLIVNEKPPNRRRLNNPPKEANSINNYQLTINNSQLKGNNLAYIIYTSGTTGRPKGVMVEHRSLTAYLAAFEKEFKITDRDIVLQQASYSFDTFGEEVYPTLLKGGMIAAPHRHVIKDIDLLVDFIRTHCITIIDCSPLLLKELNKHELPASVRLCISGGDVLKGEYIGNLLENGKEVYNTYGPTETTVCATYFRCEPPLAPDIPIGKPISNYTVYILDKKKRLLPIGIPGELCIAGCGTTRGYLNNPGLTAQRFCLRRPGGTLFEKTAPPGPPRKNFSLNMSHMSYMSYIYHSGDLARWLPDGNIQFLGRIDQQVKIRGFRIELPEIEKNLLTHQHVREAAVVVKKQQTDDRYICAYVVLQHGVNLPGGQNIAKELRLHLSRILPGFMIPAYFIPLEQIPLTPGGKIDMKALPEPVSSRVKPIGYKAPRNRVEEILAIVWSEVLSGKDYYQQDINQLPESTHPAQHSLISIDDNFFEIGGDSIKAIQISARLKRYGLDMKINDLFLHQSIRTLKESGAVTKIRREIPQALVEGEVQLTPIQEWFFENYLTGVHHFNQALMLYRPQGFDETIVRKVFEKIITHHDVLRMVFRREKHRVVQVNRGLEEDLFHLEIIHLENKKNNHIHEIVEKEASRIQTGMDLHSGPLVRLGLFKTTQGDHLLIAVHHLVIDTVSWRIIMEDLSSGYSQLEKGEIPRFPTKTDSFKYWAHQLIKYADEEDILNQLDYWRGIERSAAPSLPGNHDVKKENKTMGSTAIIEMTLDKTLTDKLLKQANQAYNTEINHLLLTALGMAVTNWAGAKNLVITLEAHGREEIIEDIDISRTVGWFTSRFPVCLDPGLARDRNTKNPGDISHQVKQVKEILRRIPKKGIGYGILRYLTPKEKLGEVELGIEPDISFNYLGQFNQLYQHPLNNENHETPGAPGPVFTLSPLKSGETHSPEMEWLGTLDITGMVLGGQLTLFFSYNKYKYKKNHMEELVNQYRSYLTAIIRHCCQVEKRVLTPADLDYPGLSIDEADELQNRIAQMKKGKEIENVYPLSPMQSGILFHYLMNPSSSAYFEQGIIHLRGVINKKLLKESINRLVEQHDILRTIFFHGTTGGPYQVVLKPGQGVRINTVFEDISHLSEPEAAEYLKEAKRIDLDKKFDLMREIPMRISLYREGTDTYQMVWSYHHILMDGWCAGVLFKELIQVYEALRAGEPVQIPPPPPYVNFIRWLAKQDKKSGLDYWQEYLQGYDEPAVLVEVDKNLAEDSHYAMKEHAFIIEDTLADALKTTASKHRVTGNEVFQTAWGILLQRYNNTGDVVFGSVVSGRPSEIDGIEHMVGIFINTVPVRVQIEKERTFSQLLEKMHRKAMLSRSYDYLPLADIQSLTSLNRRLINHLLIFENYPVQKEIAQISAEKCGFTVESVQFQEQTNFDFNVIVIPQQPFVVRFNYNSIVYEDQFTVRLGLHLQEIIKQVANNPGIPLNQIELITTAEKQQVLYDFNRTAPEYPINNTIHELFEQQVEKTPYHIAAAGSLPSKYRSHSTNMTYITYMSYISYRQLNKKSNQLAHRLREMGIKPDTIVGILVEPAIEMIIGILAILKAGGAYLPIDSHYPPERKTYMLKDSAVKWLLTNVSTGETTGTLPAGVEISDLRNQQLYTQNIHNPNHINKPADLVYMIYTSGSTGKPKGVMLEHRNLVNLFYFIFTLTNLDFRTLLQFASISFDVSFQEIFSVFLSGGELYLIDKEQRTNIPGLFKLIDKHHINTLSLPMSLLRVIFNEASYAERFPSGVRHIQTAGEQVVINDRLRDCLKQKQIYLHNHYGPSETHVVTTLTLDPLSEIPALPPIGKPVSNTAIYIMDMVGHLQPVGIAGELVIGGFQVGRGYLNNPELTAERFCLRRPGGTLFEKTAPPGPPRKNFSLKGTGKDYVSHHPIYLTGDLARWQPDGNIQFLGRIDYQVKIRGFRIEPGEIENLLLNHYLVKEAIVVSRDDEKGDKYLCAYIVPASPGVSGQTLNVAELRKYLSEKLPGYMVPSYFTPLEKIPLTGSGKVDRKALPGPGISTGDTYTPPRDNLEKHIAEIWSRVLNIDKDVIGIDTDFFQLGGHSLKAVDLITRIHRELEIKVPLAEIFNNPDIKRLSGFIKKTVPDKYTPIKIVEEKEYYVLSSAQERLYILQQMDSTGIGYNLPYIFVMEGYLQIKKLEEVFRQIVKRHESLRTSFIMIDGKVFQRIHKENCELQIISYKQIPDDKSQITNLIENFVSPFDLSRAPLLRVGLTRLNSEKYLLMIDLHHIISDGTSIRILVDEFIRFYQEKELPRLRLRYKDFARWQHDGLLSGKQKQQEMYWQHRFSGELPVLDLPTDYQRPLVQSHQGERIPFRLEPLLTSDLNVLMKKTGTTLFMMLLAVLNVLLGKYTSQDDIIIGTTSAGRNHPDLEHIIGLMWETLALRNYPQSHKIFAGFLKEIKENTINAYENQSYPFRKLVKKVADEDNLSRNPLFDVMLIVRNFHQEELQAEGLSFTTYPVNSHSSKVDITIEAYEIEQRIAFDLEYCTRLYKRETMERFAHHFVNSLGKVVKNPGIKLSGLQIMNEQEKRLILEVFNHTAVQYTRNTVVHKLFEEQAARTPDHTALLGGNPKPKEPLGQINAFGGMHLSYKKLNEKANQLAPLLRKKGVKADTIVGIMVERSMEMIIGILGILKAGGAYLPIDPDYPQERINYMLKDSSAKILLTFQEISDLSSPQAFKIRPKDTSSFGIWNLEFGISPRQGGQLAYIIYTSGTTGRPKGIMVEHRNLVAYLAAFEKEFDITPQDTILQQASYSFDTFGEEVYPLLLKGGTIAIPQPHVVKDIDLLVGFIRKHLVTLIDCSPLLLNELNKHPLPDSVRLCISGGDVLKGQYIDNLLKCGKVVYNTYGPTEATICATYFRCEEKTPFNVPIGKPIANYSLYILDKNKYCQPIGIGGELCISGPGLTRGYLNNPELTAEKFCLRRPGGRFLKKLPPWTPRKNFLLKRSDIDLMQPCNHAAMQKKTPDKKIYMSYMSHMSYIYHTGDSARWLPDGNIQFLGRIDSQVKIRGFRIELAEIENQLLQHHGVKKTVACVRHDNTGEKYLCAYLVTHQEIEITMIRKHLSRKIPRYMIPAYFVRLDKIPLTPAGKVDRNALPEPEIEITDNYIAPQDDLEKKLVEIWAEVLNINRDVIGIKTNFFHLGGQSLKAINVITRIHKEVKMKVPLAEIFNNPDIQSLSQYIKKAVPARYAPMEKAEEKEYYALSSAQKRLYVLQQMDLISISYNLPYISVLEGDLERKRFEEIFKILIKRHESLRTAFIDIDGEPFQRIHKENPKFQIPNEPQPAAGNWQLVTNTIKNFIQPFDLSCAPLLRAELIRTGEKTHILMVDMHHIISDGVSIAVFIREFMALSAGDLLPALCFQYKDFTGWQEHLREKETFKQQEKYWLKMFAGELPVLNLPTDFARPAIQDFQGSTLHFDIGIEETNALNHLAVKEKTTLSVVLVAVFNVLLSRLSGEDDIILGMATAGRRHADLEQIIGMFVNTLVLRNYPLPDKTFTAFLREVRECSLAAVENQDYPFEELVEKVVKKRDSARNPLFDVMFVLQNMDMPVLEIPGLKLRPYPFASTTAKFDLTLIAWELENGLTLNFEYSTKLFKESTIKKLITYFKTIVSAVIKDPAARLYRLGIITEKEKEQILFQFNDTESLYPKDRVIHQLFEQQVEQTPDWIALLGENPKSEIRNPKHKTPFRQINACGKMQLTYKELNKIAGQLARLLKQKGVEVDTIVGIMMERSVETIIGLLGILKAGGAYLPIDPEYPQERIDLLLKDSGAEILLTASGLPRKFKKLSIVNCQLLVVNEIPPNRRRLNNPPKEANSINNYQLTIYNLQLKGNNLAYIIYTSGTTGKPKGTMVEHLSLVNLCSWFNRYYQVTEREHATLYSNFCFDASIIEIFPFLIKGGVIHVINDEIKLDIDGLTHFFIQNNITISLLPTQVFQQFIEKVNDCPCLRVLLTGGEKLERFFKRSYQLVNNYGPTENTVITTAFTLESPSDNIPIGKPIDNVRVYILNIGSWQFQPLGVPGELCIAGDNLSRGYLNNPEFTAEKFCLRQPGGTLFEKSPWQGRPIIPPGPPRKNFSLKGSGKDQMLSCHHESMQLSTHHFPQYPITPSHHHPIYKSGDLARWLPDGNIQFLGRIDSQVKIRGFRIELREIENRLLAHDKIKNAVVTTRSQGDDKYLCAYIVPLPIETGRSEIKELEPEELAEYLSGVLPDYMIPAYFVQLEKFPLNLSGKIDGKALPVPGPAVGRKVGYIAPGNDKEKLLAGIWSTVLGIDTRQIGIHDDFFRLGGHSLKAMKMLSSIYKTFSLEIPTAEFFKIPTIRGLSNYITENKEVSYRDIKPVETKEYYALSSAQERLFFLDRFDTIGTSYHMPFMLEITGKLDKERLETVFRQLLCRHEVLRTSFQTVNNQPVQRIHDEVEFEIEYEDFQVTGAGDRCRLEAETGSHQSSVISHHSFIRPFDLSQPPLLRVKLVKISQNEHMLFLDMHHIIGDGTSMGIMINEYTTLYNGGTPPVPRIQYKDFTQWQNHLIVSGNIKKQEEYWLNLFSGEIPRLELSADYLRPEVFTFAGDILEFSLDSQKSAILRKLCTDRGITLYIGLLAVFTILLSRYSGQEDIIIGSGIAGRSHENLQEMMGLFVNMLPMRNTPLWEKPVKEFFEEVKENALKAFANQDMQFEDLVRQLDFPRDPAHNPLFDVCFVVQNFELPELRTREFIFKPCPVDNKTAKFDMTLFTSEAGNETHFNLEYCTDLYKPGTLQRMKTHFLKIIEQMVSQPAKTMNTAIGKLDLLSDREKQQLLFDFNATDVIFPNDKNICRLFAEQVEKNQDNIALVGSLSEGTRGLTPLSDPISITYKQLDGKSNQLARYLYHEKALKPGHRVGIWMTPSLNRVVSMLAVLKTGGAYVPIDPALPPERVKYMLIDASIGVVISEKRFLRALNRLQWECQDFHTYLCMDSDNIYEENELEKNELMEEELWHHVGETAHDEITGGGWLSSYSGKPFSKKEMDEYGDNILKKLEPLLHPRMRVLEIGCASGISMFRIAPLVGLYYGTDLSTVIIDKNKKRVEQEGHENIKLAPLPAHEIDKIEEKDFDLLIINSVIQCFHGHNYLRKVIKKAIDLLAEKGYLFVGDIMDQEKKEELVQELTAFKNTNREKSYTTKTDFSSELFLSRGFWQDLSREYQEIEKVEFTGKIYTIENELTKFRYDAMLTINKNKETPVNKKWNKRKYQDDLRSLSIFDTEAFHLTVPPDSFAYIIYTSGTTGLPKGVMVEHRSLVNLCTWHQRYYRITASDHATLYAGFGFDASVWELFPYLLKGSCLHIIDIWLLLDMQALNAYYEQRNITISFLPTQVCQQFMELDNSSLRILLTGGDKLQLAASKRYALYNNYGPTENTVVTTAYLVEKETGNIPIGQPIDNTRVYILERNSLQVQPVGVPGELCISGVGLARGYLNHPELTAERFCLRRPGGRFLKKLPPWTPRKNFPLNRSHTSHMSYIYRTGDLARWLSNRNIEFLGRLDQQVKIRGYRIEPGEIQTQLLRHEKIKDAVVIDKESEKGDKYLCAYIVKVPGIWDSAAGELKNYLAGKLPDYMIPLHFIELERIPLTTNGKLDRKALPGPVINRQDYVPPTNETEKTLVEVWQEVLGIQQPGVNDNFFDIGGDSIKAIQVTARLKRYGMELKVSDLFLHPTIKESAKCVEAAVEGEEEDSLTFNHPGFSSLSAEQLEAFEDEFSDID